MTASANVDARLLGLYFGHIGRPADAAEMFRACLKRRPEDSEVRTQLGLALLAMGEYREGFAQFESRFGWGERWPKPSAGLPAWDGSPLSGRRLLVLPEQGWGDHIQFARLIPAGGAFRALPALARLFRHSGVAVTDNAVGYDVEAPIGSLPYLTGLTLDQLPMRESYLSPPPDAIERFNTIPRFGKGRKVGIVWQGNPANTLRDRFRSIDVTLLDPLWSVPGVQWFSLQVPPRDVPKRVANVGQYIRDFADTAGAMRHLDLIVTVDTAVAHLAGAMGKPTWLLLSCVPDWRWMLEREDSPWYPSMRLFRQPKSGDWPPLIERVAAELRSWPG